MLALLALSTGLEATGFGGGRVLDLVLIAAGHFVELLEHAEGEIERILGLRSQHPGLGVEVYDGMPLEADFLR